LLFHWKDVALLMRVCGTVRPPVSRSHLKAAPTIWLL
jgi:hypothetical protein